MIINESGGSSLSRTARGAIASFNARLGNSPLKSLVVDIDPVQAGTGDPSPENVRPISGWTGVKVTRTGKNLLRNEATSKTVSGVTFTVNADGSITINGVAEQTINYSINSNISLPSGTYKLNGFPSGYGSCRLQWEVQVPGEDKIYAEDRGSGVTVSWEGEPSVNNVFIIIFTGYQFENVTVYPMIRLSTEANNTYEPYQGATYARRFLDEAGTVYVGTLDATNGVLTVQNYGLAVFDGSEDYELSAIANSYTQVFLLADKKISNKADYNQYGNRSISNMFQPSIITSQGTLKENTFYWGAAASAVAGEWRLGWGAPGATVEEFKAFLSANPLQILVPTTPLTTTYQLTPTEVTTLLGVNNIWADTGDSEVAYWTNPEVIQVINSSGLNLKVVGGTTQPTSPVENTVWVNTSTAINGYAFSATQPINPVEGMVWFSTGTSSNAAMNVDKKNTVMLYPLNCKQYVSGAWVEKTAKTYKDGEWVEWWTGVLFDNGNEYTAITGGFSGVGSYQRATNNDGYLGVLAGYGSTGATLSNNAIDITDFSTLTAIVKSDGNNTKALGIAKNRDTTFAASKSFSTLSDLEITLDISNFTGLYYIGILSNSNNWAYAKYIKLER